MCVIKPLAWHGWLAGGIELERVLVVQAELGRSAPAPRAQLKPEMACASEAEVLRMRLLLALKDKINKKSINGNDATSPVRRCVGACFGKTATVTAMRAPAGVRTCHVRTHL